MPGRSSGATCSGVIGLRGGRCSPEPQRRDKKGLVSVSTVALPRPERRTISAAVEVRWLVGGLVFAFLVPFVFADLLHLQRDAYLAIYVCSLALLVAAWAHQTQQPIREFLTRRWQWALLLGIACAGILVFTVLREPATARPGGWALAGALAWRGLVYGTADGVLLSVFPILTVFGVFAKKPLRERSRKAVAGIGALALAVSLLFTAVYHLGYPDFRNSKVNRPMTGDVIWSVPTLATLSPLGTPIAHVAVHVSAVLHSNDTDLFLPPHYETR